MAREACIDLPFAGGTVRDVYAGGCSTGVGVLAYGATILDSEMLDNITGILVGNPTFTATALVQHGYISLNRDGVVVETTTVDVTGAAGVDLGAGPQGSTGGNTLSGNTDVDLFFQANGTQSLATLPAQHNCWDHVWPTEDSQLGHVGGSPGCSPLSMVDICDYPYQLVDDRDAQLAGACP
jgi:hypothetical protein